MILKNGLKYLVNLKNKQNFLQKGRNFVQIFEFLKVIIKI